MPGGSDPIGHRNLAAVIQSIGYKAKMQPLYPSAPATRLGSRLLFFTEFLESGIGSQRIPEGIEP
jgi:hypothetical protein